jgi:hypothetical protein
MQTRIQALLPNDSITGSCKDSLHWSARTANETQASEQSGNHKPRQREAQAHTCRLHRQSPHCLHNVSAQCECVQKQERSISLPMAQTHSTPHAHKPCSFPGASLACYVCWHTAIPFKWWPQGCAQPDQAFNRTELSAVVMSHERCMHPFCVSQLYCSHVAHGRGHICGMECRGAQIA